MEKQGTYDFTDNLQDTGVNPGLTICYVAAAHKGYRVRRVDLYAKDKGHKQYECRAMINKFPSLYKFLEAHKDWDFDRASVCVSYKGAELHINSTASEMAAHVTYVTDGTLDIEPLMTDIGTEIDLQLW